MTNTLTSNISPSQNFMTNPQQKYMEVHEVCNNFWNNLLSIKEFSEKLRRPASTIRTWIRRGELPKGIVKKIGSTIFINAIRFYEWFEYDI